jgi:hypothetical protein
MDAITAGLPFLIPHASAVLALTYLNGMLHALEIAAKRDDEDFAFVRRAVAQSRQVALDIVNQHGNDNGARKGRRAT